MFTLKRFAGVTAIALGLSACGGNDLEELDLPIDDEGDNGEVTTVVDVAVDNGNFTTLVSLLGATGLDETLADEDGSFTVFAPTDDAFEALGEDTLAALQEDPDALEDILLYHVIADSEVGSSDAIGLANTTVEMANGDEAGLSLWNEDLLINTSLVTTVDVQADNGVIHVIDTVLMPPDEPGARDQTIAEIASGNDDLSTLVTALGEAELVAPLDSNEETYTVFAPTNAAFDMVGEENLQALLDDPEALSAVLQQHVVAGAEINSVNAFAANGTSVETLSGAEIPVAFNDNRMLTVGGAVVSVTDIYASNGVIHLIDSVITGDVDLPSPPVSIVERAEQEGNFSTLIDALVATGLDETLSDLDTDFTVFAPTDAAFDQLEEGTLDALLADTDTLSDILLYHVISGSEVAADAAISTAESDDSLVAMANGDNIGLSLVGSDLFVNTSAVIATNVMADNGVIHGIDRVMMPPEPTQSDDTVAGTAAASSDFSTLVNALQQANLVDALDDTDATYTVFAPTNAAFDKIPDEDLTALLNDEEALTEVLLSHVVEGAAVGSVSAYTLNGTSVETMSGNNVSVIIEDGSLKVGGATVENADIETTNGVIHAIDTVIMP